LETKFSIPRKLIDLEEVINTRTPVWDIDGSGDVRIKFDTDVNGQEWYVLSDDRNVDPLYGKVECWAFPHFNGAFDQYRYVPVAFCFKTFAELLAAYPTERAMWGYNEEEYARRLAHAAPDTESMEAEEHPHLELAERMQAWGLEQRIFTSKEEAIDHLLSQSRSAKLHD